MKNGKAENLAVFLWELLDAFFDKKGLLQNNNFLIFNILE